MLDFMLCSMLYSVGFRILCSVGFPVVLDLRSCCLDNCLIGCYSFAYLPFSAFKYFDSFFGG